eukprot:augustus_masked-scaffold_5-processed-gene-6.31-mRNA-1 protein AED:1.00 eAED:1.00 QI:0/-1/0/0/-1/1/1/0/916
MFSGSGGLMVQRSLSLSSAEGESVGRKSDILRGDESADEDEGSMLSKNEDFAHKVGRLVELFEEKKYRGRVLMCIFALVLLWSCSFAVCRAFVNAILQSPSLERVENELLNLIDQTVGQNDSHVNCVVREFENCNRIYHIQNQQEIDRFTSILQKNADNLNSLSELKAECSTLNQDIDNILRNGTLLPSRFSLPKREDKECVVEEIDRVTKRQAKAAAAVAVGESAEAESKTVLEDFNAQVEARRAYDQKYFNVTLPNALASLVKDAKDVFPDAERLRESLEKIQLQAEACASFEDVFDKNGNKVDCAEIAVPEVFQGQIDGLTEKFRVAQQVVDTFRDVYRVMSNVVSTILNAIQSVRNNWFFGAIIGKLFDLIGGGAFDLSAFTIDAADFNLGPIPGGDLRALRSAVSSAFESFQIDQLDRLQELDQLFSELGTLDQTFLENLFDGYDGPALFNSIFSLDIAEIIRENLKFVPVSFVPEEVGELVSNAKQRAANLINQNDEREFSLFNYPTAYYTAFKENLLRIGDLLVLFDVVWRIMQSILLVKKYWNISGINTPPANMQSDEGKVFQPKQTSLQKGVKLITNPILSLSILTLSFVFQISLIYLAYNPLYSAYIDGCIEHSYDDIPNEANGTMFFRNVFPVAVNLAAREGNNIIKTKVDTLNTERALTCQDYYRDSLERRDDQSSTYLNLNTDLDILKESLTPYVDCVDWVHFDSIATILDEEARAIAPLIERVKELECYKKDILLAQERFSVEFSDDIAMYQCQLVEECILPCPGVEYNTLEKTSFDSMCTAEWGFHAYFLTGLVSFFMYFCLNISRYYIMRGVLAAFYHHISLDLYSYRGSCTLNGDIILPPEVVSEEYTFRDLLQKRLEKALKSFAWSGKIEMFLAFAMNLPWIVFLAIVAPSLQFENRE